MILTLYPPRESASPGTECGWRLWQRIEGVAARVDACLYVRGKAEIGFLGFGERDTLAELAARAAGGYGFLAPFGLQLFLIGFPAAASGWVWKLVGADEEREEGESPE